MRARLDEHPQVGALGPMALWALLNAVIDDGEDVVDLLSDQGERIEQRLFEGDLDQSEAIYRHRRRADRLIRSVHPMLPHPRNAGAWRARCVGARPAALPQRRRRS